jgi:chromosome segregation ATPase
MGFVSCRDLTAATAEVKSVKKSEATARKAQETAIAEFEKLRNGCDELNSQLLKGQEDLSKANSLSQSLQREVNSLKFAYNTAEIALREQSMETERMKSELDNAMAERDRLLVTAEQQKSALAVQAKRSEDSLKSLWDRQETLERVEKDADYSLNQLVTVQEGLQSLLAQEGILMHSELLGVKKLVTVLSSVRDRLLEINTIRSELEAEKSLRIQLEASQKLEVQSMLATGMDDGSNVYDQLARYRNAVEASDARANYWQSVAQKAQMMLPQSSIEALETKVDEAMAVVAIKEENESLKAQLAAALADAAVANAALEKSQENMQSEFSSLWVAVQELNKLDAVKEQALADLITDRDRILGERDSGHKKFNELSVKYASLQRDLEVFKPFVVGCNLLLTIIRIE